MRCRIKRLRKSRRKKGALNFNVTKLEKQKQNHHTYVRHIQRKRETDLAFFASNRVIPDNSDHGGAYLKHYPLDGQQQVFQRRQMPVVHKQPHYAQCWRPPLACTFGGGRGTGEGVGTLTFCIFSAKEIRLTKRPRGDRSTSVPYWSCYSAHSQSRLFNSAKLRRF